MDKSFNDQELSDIMKEIEALEDNFQNEAGEKLEAPVTVMEASPIMEELAEMHEEEAIPTQKVVPMQPKSKSASRSSAATSMSFKVSGELKLDLQFDVGGKVICLEVNESGLHIEMEDGMTFSVPLKKTA